MHVILSAVIGLVVLVLGFVVGMCITAKRADEAMSEAIQNCTRPAPHICKVNGPCNGYPKETL